MSGDQYIRFTDLTYEDFKKLANDESLSKYEKIGFPNQYREGKEELIFADIQCKLTNLANKAQKVLDIGPGCSDLPVFLMALCKDRQHELLLVDSIEMLSQLPDQSHVRKYIGTFPNAIDDFDYLKGRLDVILVYSVLHYIFVEDNIFSFLDKSLSLLAPGGQMLIGDVPNISKRKRFFSSETGKKFHQAFTGTKQDPSVEFLMIEEDKIDDSVVFGLINRARNQGFDAYVLPQHQDLPMANRREDILITRP